MSEVVVLECMAPRLLVVRLGADEKARRLTVTVDSVNDNDNAAIILR